MVEQVIVTGVELATQFGIGYLAGSAVKALTPENASTAVKVCTTVAGIAVGGAVGLKANEYIESTANDIKNGINIIKTNKKLKKQKKELEEAQKEEAAKAAEETEEIKDESEPKKAKKSKKN